MNFARFIAFALGGLLGVALCRAEAQAPVEIREALAIGRVGSGGGRSPIPVDPVWSQIAKDSFQWPSAGQSIALTNGRSAKWEKIEANKDGWFEGPALAGGYVACAVDLPEAQNTLIQAEGNTFALINGQVHTGDPYAYGYLAIPARLQKGPNHLLFASGRGRLRVKLSPVRSNVMIDPRDATLPDVLLGEQGKLWCGVVAVNATSESVSGAVISASAGGESAVDTVLPDLPAMTLRKVPIQIAITNTLSGEKLKVSLQLKLETDEKQGGTSEIELRIRKPNEVHKRTFISSIDNSIQYYAVNPAQKPSKDNLLILTLHGAAVEALGQASAYASKDDATLVAPTNRRPYGFDWEDMGRLDALEVLDIAEKKIPHDPHRVILTGHSMGGHGTWQVGLTVPDRFAAIGPSAGWSSFLSYGGGRRFQKPSPVEQMLQRAMSPSNTLALARNSLMEDVYILHGDADDNVPVSEARMMRDALKFHPRLQYHEEKGAGHWWGSKCVDWPPMFEMFEKARLPDDRDVKEIEFTTADPAISGRCHWVTVEQQIRPLEISAIKLHRQGNQLTGQTTNIAAFTLDARKLGQRPASIELDQQTVELPAAADDSDKPLVLALRQKKWVASAAFPAGEKTAQRGGGFKQVFANHLLLVYGTRGTAQELARNRNDAEFLAETLYYRGNGALDIVSDKAFEKLATGDRNVLLFGNADNNSAWQRLLAHCPCKVGNGSAQVGDRKFTGKDLAMLLLYPRPDSKTALVGAIASTGPTGGLLAERLPILVSGVAYPDWILIEADALTTGDKGIAAAGFFGNDWLLDPGQSVFADKTGP